MIRVYFTQPDPERASVTFAYACGVGERMCGDYVFVRANSLQDLRSRCQKHFALAADPGQADLVAFPNSYVPGPLSDTAESVAQQHGLPCVFFRNPDRPPPAKIKYGVVFQECVFASRRQSCERSHIGVIDDLLIGRSLAVRDKSVTPIVSFQGSLGSGRHREIVKRLLFGRRASLGQTLRRTVVQDCELSSLIKTHFSYRLFNKQPKSDQLAMRDSYIQGIVDSDYVLCIRGNANFSYRLYETLCLGRIPIVLNTDLSLPLSNSIDWPHHCVWIEPADFGRVPQRVREFHDALSPDEFRELQEANRALWVDWLEPVAFWRHALGELCVQRRSN